MTPPRKKRRGGREKIKGIRDARAEMGSGWRERKKVPSPSSDWLPFLPLCFSFLLLSFLGLGGGFARSQRGARGGGEGAERRSSMFQVWKSTNIWQNKSIPTAKLRGLCLWMNFFVVRGGFFPQLEAQGANFRNPGARWCTFSPYASLYLGNTFPGYFFLPSTVFAASLWHRLQAGAWRKQESNFEPSLSLAKKVGEESIVYCTNCTICKNCKKTNDL